MKKLYLLIALISYLIPANAQDCNTDELEVLVTITTDQYGVETSWNITDNETAQIYASSNQGAYDNNTTYNTIVCIPQNACVTFTINDTYGDGICCGFGQGSFQVTFGGNVIAEGGNFGSEYSTAFNCQPGIACNAALTIAEGNHTTANSNYWYEFTPTQPGMFEITTCDLNNCNTKIWIYDTCNTTIAESNIGTIYYNDNNVECGAAAFVNIPMGTNTTYYIRIGDSGDDCEGSTIDWSLNYLGPITGCTDPTACNYSPLATVSDGNCFYAGDEECPGPDLILLENRIQETIYMDILDNNDGCAIEEGCLQGYGDREIIRFTTHIKNIGETDYYIGSPENNSPEDSIQFTYDNCHGHWHYDGYAEYLLYDTASVEIPIGFKNGFCVLDLECSDGGIGKYGCNDMGISAGCGDIYDAFLDCQWIDVTDIADGTYTFVARVNWDNAPDLLGRYETDFSNNWAQACIEISTTNNGQRQVNLIEECEVYEDCAGEPYGSAQPDCTGVCNGTAITGDIDASGSQDIADAQNYVTQILGNDISPTPCNDLNADNQITVYDAALLASCINYGQTHQHPSTNFHDHCKFPAGVTNPNDMVTLNIDETSINYTDGYFDINITNPDNAVSAYQFNLSGVQIMSVENLIDPTQYPIMPQAIMGGDMVIGISYQGSLISKTIEEKPLCRIHFTDITNDEICIASITSIVNQDAEETMTTIGGNCLQVVGIQNPLTSINASISPNPLKDAATLTFPNTTSQAFTLKITDPTGRLIRQYNDIRTNTFKLERGTLESGVYLYQLESDKKIATGKFMVQ